MSNVDQCQLIPINVDQSPGNDLKYLSIPIIANLYWSVLHNEEFCSVMIRFDRGSPVFTFNL